MVFVASLTVPVTVMCFSLTLNRELTSLLFFSISFTNGSLVMVTSDSSTKPKTIEKLAAISFT